MNFTERLWLLVGLLYVEKRVTYRRLQKEFRIDGELLDDLRHELLAKGLAIDEDGEVLVWSDDSAPASGQDSPGLGRAASADVGVLATRAIAREHPPWNGPVAGTGRVSDAERRQLTVMFCDLVGSTALSTRMDPEDLRDVITAFQDECRTAVELYDGFIARYMGDGLLIYFGYPKAHEDDAVRAARAGLAIVSAMARLNSDRTGLHGAKLSVRVGIATGPVVVGDFIGEGAAEEAAVVGETPNLAARLQGMVQPDEVAVSDATRRMLRDGFEVEDLGVHELKGIAEPVQAWRVTAERDARARLEVARSAHALPLVGRQEEIGLLTRAWEGARTSRGQMVLMQGEAGVGKSRLVEALKRQVAEQEHTWIAIRASPYHSGSPLHPVIDQIQRGIGWSEDDSDDVKLQKLERAMSAQTGFAADERIPLFASLLSLPLPEGRYVPLTLSPKAQRDVTLDAICDWSLGFAELRPVLMIWEDLHWADPSTVELVGLMLEQIPTVRMLMVATFRPEFVSPWGNRAHLTPITLSRLERPEVEAVATNLAAGKRLPQPVLEHIMSKADGVPLYVEELTRAILDSDVLVEEADRFELKGSLADLFIPETLQDSLMSRLDREPSMRVAAQIGSVIGREFQHEMVGLVAPEEGEQLSRGLDGLVASEILYQRGRGQRARYVFKHTLIRDAAYQSLLRRTRRQFHARVAQLLEERFTAIAEASPELVAHHYMESGEFPGKAIEHWQRAADMALARDAKVEAVSHLTAAISCLEALELSEARNELELALQTRLGAAVAATRGFADPEVRRCYERAQDLCGALGNKTRLALILRGQQLSEMVTGDLERSRAFAGQLAEVTEQQGDVGLVVGSCHALSQTNVFLGSLEEGMAHAERGMALFEPAVHRTQGWPGGQPGEQCFLYGALARWLLGEPDSALSLVEKGISLLREFGDPFSLVNFLALGSVVPSWRGDKTLVRQWAGESAETCSKNGYEYWNRFAECLLAWVDAKESPSSEAVKDLEGAVRRYEKVGARGGSASISLALLGECCVESGEIGTGLRVAELGLERVKQNKVRFLEAEFLRLRGELLMSGSPGTADEAALSLRKAYEIACSQKARALELRTLQSFVRAGIDREDGGDVRDSLRACYERFTEGFETADLRRTRALLTG